MKELGMMIQRIISSGTDTLVIIVCFCMWNVKLEMNCSSNAV